MIVTDEAEMLAVGRELAGTLAASAWIAIDGPLGAGKTVLCKGILQGLGYQGEVASPSYAIVHLYEPPELSIAVAHADLYRLNDVEELEELGLEDGRGERITLVEWASRGSARSMRPSHLIQIEPLLNGDRKLTFQMVNNDIGA